MAGSAAMRRPPGASAAGAGPTARREAPRGGSSPGPWRAREVVRRPPPWCTRGVKPSVSRICVVSTPPGRG